MGNDTQLSRRSFISRLATIAGGFVVAGSATELLTGCTGGGGGLPSPVVPGAIPEVPTAQRVSVGVQAMLDAFEAQTGIATNTATITPLRTEDEFEAAIRECFLGQANGTGSVDLSKVLLPFYSGRISDAQQAGTNPALRTAAQLGITEAQVQQFITDLRTIGFLEFPSSGSNNAINQPVMFDFTANGQPACGIAGGFGGVFTAISTLTFPALGDAIGENFSAPGPFAAACTEFNRAPDGHIHFDLEAGFRMGANGSVLETRREVNVPAQEIGNGDPLNGLGVQVENLRLAPPAVGGVPGGADGRVTAQATFTFKIGDVSLWIRDVVVECTADVPGGGTGGTGGTGGS